MSKRRTPLFLLIILIIIIVGISSYLFYKKAHITPPPATSSFSSTSSSKQLESIFHTGKTQKCTVLDANGITEIYYMSGATVHGEFSSQGMQTINLLADGALVYIWVGSQTKGSSMPELDANTINNMMQTNGVPGFDINAVKNQQCTKWSANPSALGAPYTVVFTPVNQ